MLFLNVVFLNNVKQSFEAEKYVKKLHKEFLSLSILKYDLMRVSQKSSFNVKYSINIRLIKYSIDQI